MQFGPSFVLNNLQIADLVSAKRIGFNFVEFYIGDFWRDMSELELQLIAIRDILDSYDLFCIIHLSHLNSQLMVDSDLWTNYVDKLTEQIEMIGKLGLTKKIVFHGVFGRTENPKEITPENAFEIKIAAIKEWLQVAQKYKMELLLENTDESVKDLTKAFKALPKIGFTFDIGHANILFPTSAAKKPELNISNMMQSFKKKLKHIHIHDNFSGINERADKHMPIGTGSIDFFRFFKLLKEMKYDDTITLEIYNPLFLSTYLESSFKVVKEILEKQDPNKLRNV
ncbi:MAG: sugar phosphate isomerase/epimerase [Asgard group archaeon]|nr:sugar phosphate isomerase/epimerase [Asgard group archaeon]